MLTVQLPYPPSLNRLYRHVGKRVIISAEGRRYASAVNDAVRAALAAGQIVPPAPHAATLLATPPDRRRRDLDNLPKRLLDLTYKAMSSDEKKYDDSQVVRLVIEWRLNSGAPGVTVLLRPARFVNGVVQVLEDAA